MEDGDDLYCKYSFNYGLDWSVIFGLEHGVSQIARRTPGRETQTFVWNYPLDVSFRSSNVYGWPQVVLTVYGINMMGKDVVRGYGCMHLPTVPGRYVRYVRLYTPRSSSLCQQFTAWLTGNPPEFFNPKFIAQNKGSVRSQKNAVCATVWHTASAVVGRAGICICLRFLLHRLSVFFIQTYEPATSSALSA